MGELTLEHFLIAASSPGGSLAPLANALLVPDFKVRSAPAPRTHLVPPLVLTGHISSLPSY
jgi:hypothetical protein